MAKYKGLAKFVNIQQNQKKGQKVKMDPNWSKLTWWIFRSSSFDLWLPKQMSSEFVIVQLL